MSKEWSLVLHMIRGITRSCIQDACDKLHMLSKLYLYIQYCGQTLTIDHMLLECALLQECRDEYYTVDSFNALFETIPETCIVEFLRWAGFSYLIWCNLLTSTNPPPDVFNVTRLELCRTANMSWRTCVVVKQIQSNPIYNQYVSRFLFRSKWIMSNYCPYESYRTFTRWPLSQIHFAWFHCHQYADLLSNYEGNIAFCKCLMEIVFRQYIECVDCLLPIVFWRCNL